MASSSHGRGLALRWALVPYSFMLCTGFANEPAPFVPDLAPLRDEPLWPLPGQEVVPLAPSANAEEHARALRADPQHGQPFVVRDVSGNLESTRVVFLIPQFHRNPLMPIGWTSLGTAIMEVQSNLDVLISRLVLAHGLRCLGAEGNWLLDMGYPPELRQAAQWHHDLEQRKTHALADLRREPALDSTQEIHQDLDAITRILGGELRRHAQILDGAGIALSRTTLPARVHRFGIEDPKLNQAALRLLAERRAVDEEIAKRSPASQSAIADAMGEMWLAEIPAYTQDVLSPLQNAIEKADSLRLFLRREMALDAAEGLGRFVSLAKHIRASVLRPDEIDQYTQYYRAVSQNSVPVTDHTMHDGGTTEATSSQEPDSHVEKKRQELRQLRQDRDRLQSQYEEIAFAQRETAAARIVWEGMQNKETCAVVMGAAHEQGLRDALLDVTQGRIGIVTITPYDFATANDSAENEAPAESAR